MTWTLPAPGPGADAPLRHHLAQAYRIIEQALNGSVQTGQDYYVGEGRIWITAPDGTKHYISVDNAGNIGADGVSAQPLDATLSALAATVWAANALPIGTGADVVSQVAFAANTFPARGSTGNLVAKTISDDALLLLADSDVPRIGTANTWTGSQTVQHATLPVVFLNNTGNAADSRLASVAVNTSGDLIFNVVNDANSVSFGTLTFHRDGRLSATNIHNNDPVTGTANQFIASGTYTPTLTNNVNVAASTAYVWQWMRVGNVVTVSGKIDIDPTASGGTVTRVDATVPISSSFNAAEQAGGTFACDTINQVGRVQAITGTATVGLIMAATDTANRGYSVCFQYLVR